MDGAFGSRRRARRPNINITSLIDVMFLLIIFFAVSTTFQQQQLGIDLALPAAASAAEQPVSPHMIDVAADGAVTFQNKQLSTGMLKDALQALFATEPEAVVVLRADRKAAFQDVVTVMDVARQVGGQRLVIPTVTPEIE